MPLAYIVGGITYNKIKGEREYSYRSDLAINHNIDRIQCGASGNEILNDFV